MNLLAATITAKPMNTRRWVGQMIEIAPAIPAAMAAWLEGKESKPTPPLKKWKP
jgi:hypothetical protein